jgi:hypothetical protein
MVSWVAPPPLWRRDNPILVSPPIKGKQPILSAIKAKVQSPRTSENIEKIKTIGPTAKLNLVPTSLQISVPVWFPARSIKVGMRRVLCKRAQSTRPISHIPTSGCTREWDYYNQYFTIVGPVIHAEDGPVRRSFPLSGSALMHFLMVPLRSLIPI